MSAICDPLTHPMCLKIINHSSWTIWRMLWNWNDLYFWDAKMWRRMVFFLIVVVLFVKWYKRFEREGWFSDCNIALLTLSIFAFLALSYFFFLLNPFTVKSIICTRMDPELMLGLSFNKIDQLLVHFYSKYTLLLFFFSSIWCIKVILKLHLLHYKRTSLGWVVSRF